MSATEHLIYSAADLELYNSLRELLKKFPDDLVNNCAYLIVWYAFEAVRNRYGGMPPKQRIRPDNRSIIFLPA